MQLVIDAYISFEVGCLAYDVLCCDSLKSQQQHSSIFHHSFLSQSYEIIKLIFMIDAWFKPCRSWIRSFDWL